MTRITNASRFRKDLHIQVLRRMWVEFDRTGTQEGVVRPVRAVESSPLVGLGVPKVLGRRLETVERILETGGKLLDDVG